MSATAVPPAAPAAAPAASARLTLSGITKRFPGTLANDSIDLRLAPGEIHALLGENGAGKSTLVKIVYGVLSADAGTVLWEGRPVEIHTPAAARRLGIGMVFQHFSLFEAFTVGGETSPSGLEKPGRASALPWIRSARIAEVCRKALRPRAFPPHTAHAIQITLSVGRKRTSGWENRSPAALLASDPKAA